jgi:hypothetical protein
LLFHGSISNGLRVAVLRGETEILKRAYLLAELAERCGQAGAMHWLEHFFTVPTFRGRTPCLLLGVNANADEDFKTTDVSWAVLMYEFSVLGFGLRTFSTDDISGFRTVIAPDGERHAAVTSAANALLQRGAQMLMISFSEDSTGSEYALDTNVACKWAVRERPVMNTLLPKGTYQETLMSVGKTTRFNMRYYRRRLERRVPMELIGDARGLFTSEEIDAINEQSLNPFSQALNRRQFRSVTNLRGGFLLCLRTAGGDWLGLIGGWRQAGTTVLLWQMNRAGYEQDSLGTVMRSYFVEHEIERGAGKIMFYGGTPNSIQNSFLRSKVTDVVVVRKSLWARLFRGVASIFAKPRWWMKSPNFMARAFCSDLMEWHESGSGFEQLK